MTCVFFTGTFSWAQENPAIPLHKTTLAAPSIFKTLTENELFEVLAGIRLLHAGKTPHAVNGMLIESYRHCDDQARIKFVSGSVTREEEDEDRKTTARFVIDGKEGLQYEIQYQDTETEGRDETEPQVNITIVDEGHVEYFERIRDRFNAKEELGTDWLRISATMKEAYRHYHGWIRTTDKKIEVEFSDQKFIFDADVLNKAAQWYEKNPNYERFGYFVGKKNADGTAHVTDFIPVGSFVLDIAQGDAGRREKFAKEGLTQLACEIGTTGSMMQAMETFAQEKFGLIDGALVIHNPEGVTFQLTAHSHYRRSPYPKPSPQDLRNNRGSIDLVYSVQEGTFWFYRKDDQRELSKLICHIPDQNRAPTVADEDNDHEITNERIKNTVIKPNTRAGDDIDISEAGFQEVAPVEKLTYGNVFQTDDMVMISKTKKVTHIDSFVIKRIDRHRDEIRLSAEHRDEKNLLRAATRHLGTPARERRRIEELRAMVDNYEKLTFPADELMETIIEHDPVRGEVAYTNIRNWESSGDIEIPTDGKVVLGAKRISNCVGVVLTWTKGDKKYLYLKHAPASWNIAYEEHLKPKIDKIKAETDVKDIKVVVHTSLFTADIKKEDLAHDLGLPESNVIIDIKKGIPPEYPADQFEITPRANVIATSNGVAITFPKCSSMNQFILWDTMETRKKPKVNEHIDLTPIPKEEGQLERNMETLARQIAWHNTFGLDVRYVLENDSNEAALALLQGEIKDLKGISEQTKKELLSRIGQAHSGDDVIDIYLKNIENIDRTREIKDNEYVIALRDNEQLPGISIPNYGAASAMGLSLAALNIARKKAKTLAQKEEYGRLRRKVLKIFNSIFEQYKVIDEEGDFTEDELELMVSGGSDTKLYYTILYALPPIVKAAIELIDKYHDEMQLLLQAA